MDIYFIDVSIISKEQCLEISQYISKERQGRIRKINAEGNKKRNVFSEALLRYALIKHGIFQMPVIHKTSQGKPYIQHDNVHFSISHAGKWVCVVVSNQEIGIDIEYIRSSIKVASKFSEEEHNYIMQGDVKQQNERFTEVWTKKESYLKYLGVGLVKPLVSFSTIGYGRHVVDNGFLQKHIHIDTFKIEDYYCSICKKNADVNYLHKMVTFCDVIEAIENKQRNNS